MPDNPARLSPESKAGSCPTDPRVPPEADLQLQAEIIANMFAGVALVRTCSRAMNFAAGARASGPLETQGGKEGFLHNEAS